MHFLGRGAGRRGSNLTNSATQKLKLCYTNTDNSLLSKINELKVRIREKDYDIILLNEIKPKNGEMPDSKVLSIDGYTMHMNETDSPETRGVCIYVKNKYKSQIVNLENTKYKDMICVSISGSGNKKILVSCVYRSGSPDKAREHDEDLFSEIRKFADIRGHNIKVMCGDFNLNRIKWTPEPEITSEHWTTESSFIECIRDTFMCQHVTEPTRFRSGNRPTCDDLIFSTSESDILNLSYTPSIGASDHVTLECDVATNLTPLKTTKTAYVYDKGDYTKMKERLTINWDELLTGKSAQESVDLFERKYHEAVNECIPQKKVDSAKGPKPLWLNAHALKKVKKKHSSWTRYLNTKDGTDYQEYIRKRNEATHAVRRAKREYEKAIAKECRKNSKAVWNYLKRKNKTSMPNLKKTDGSTTTSDKEAADALNEQYHSVFTREDTDNIPQMTPKELLTEKLKTFTIEENDVLKALKNLQTNKSPGIDQVHPRVLKELADTLAHPLTLIFRTSIETSELPRNWLDAVITPIFKKGNKTLPENYRPVSLTSLLCKILERLVVTQLIKHLKANELACLQQHGFVKNKSVTTNLLEALNIWTEALFHNIPVDVLYLDYAKAFDTVPHQRLVKQVETFGVTEKALKWIESFLSNRRQKVRVNNDVSDWSPVISGVPQGSILGPILFTLFVFDIPGEIESLISMFADDTKIYQLLTTDTSGEELEESLHLLEEWAEKMQMRFHPGKCKVMHLGSKNPKKNYSMKDGNGGMHVLEETTVEKDLGVKIDNLLKFTDHCQAKINTANKTLGFIRHSFQYMDKEIFSMLYKSLVRPHLEFASCVWSPQHKYNKDALERVQRRATKLVPGLYNLSYSDRLKELGLETLEYRRRRADMLETYRILNGDHQLNKNCQCPLCPNKEMLESSVAQHTRGHSRKLHTQLAVGARNNFFATRVVKDWNCLSEATVTSTTISAFKAGLAKDWKDEQMHHYTL